MLERVGYASLDDLMAAAVPERDPVGRPGPARARSSEQGAAAELRSLAGRQPARRADDRPGLPRHHHPAGDPAQRARGPELVHRLHAVPARDLPGPARGAAQLPDRRRRPGRPADRQRVAARRGHGGGRGDDARTPRQPRRRPGPSSSTPTACPQTIEVVRTRAEAMGIEVVVADLDEGLPDGELSGAAGVLPRSVRPGRRPAPADRGGPRARRPGRRRRRPAGADAARGAGRARRRRRGRVVPALRRAAVLRRPARRVHGRRRRARAAPARPPRGRLGRRRGPAGLPPGPADPRAAHPPRQGDVQHLHRAGAARRGRVDVRRLPRPRRACARSRPAPTATPRCWPRRCARAASRSSTARSSTP